MKKSFLSTVWCVRCAIRVLEATNPFGWLLQSKTLPGQDFDTSRGLQFFMLLDSTKSVIAFPATKELLDKNNLPLAAGISCWH